MGEKGMIPMDYLKYDLLFRWYSRWIPIRLSLTAGWGRKKKKATMRALISQNYEQMHQKTA